MTTIRPFTRTDRDQLTDLVNTHVCAVVPNLSVSVQTLLSSMEGEPGEVIVDPWVVERATLVAEQRQRVVAAAHLVRYADAPHVGASLRGHAEIRWLVAALPTPFWPDAADAGKALLPACLALAHRWGVAGVLVEGGLPAPGVYGVPEQWPHVRELLADNGFTHERTEIVLVGRVDELIRRHGGAVLPAAAQRSVGINGVRISAAGTDGTLLGWIEVDTTLEAGTRTTKLGGWADIGNLEVAPDVDRPPVVSWLLSRAADWLDLGGVSRLLAYADASDQREVEELRLAGFEILTRTIRGLRLLQRGDLQEE